MAEGTSGPLNLFAPYPRLAANHENQLTRALLVVLRYSPMARTVWLRMVAPERHLDRLPSASFVTQQRAIRYAPDDAAESELVSVFLGPEEPPGEDDLVFSDDRGQVLDAIVDFGGELIVVVENKVAPSDDWQARYLNIVGARVKIGDGQTRIALLWRDVLEAFMGLTERGLVTGVEAMVVDDFMTYIEDHFPFLGPFRTLRLCQRDRDRIHRRLRQLLADIASAEAYITDHGPCIFLESEVVNRAYLRLTDDGDAVNLVAYPADTLTQARALYPDKKLIKAFRVLADSKDWDGGPNFHFGFQSRGFCWTYGGIG